MSNKLRIYTRYINQCVDCPNFDYYSTSCLIGGKFRALPGSPRTIPDWCPLPVKIFRGKK